MLVTPANAANIYYPAWCTLAMPGDISQKQRELTLQGFRDGTFRCLIATNVAARGLDIPEVDLVLQVGSTTSFWTPHVPNRIFWY